jgi:hypothetical protein
VALLEKVGRMTIEQWHPSYSSPYLPFENGQGTTDEIAYQVLGQLAFASICKKSHDILTFATNHRIYVADIGCYLGGSTLRWYRVGQDFARIFGLSVAVLGSDIYIENIVTAQGKYAGDEGIRFEYMQKNQAIPMYTNQGYHLIFSTFVIDTIGDLQDVVALIKNMITALIDHGELYMLRLHSNSLASSSTFTQYRIECRQPMHDGEKFSVHLTGETGEVSLLDTFWSLPTLMRIYAEIGCHVEVIDLISHPDHPIYPLLIATINGNGLSSDMAEWHVPLYQILRITKRAT